MKRVAIVGGETHIGEVTALVGGPLEIVGVTVRQDQREWAAATFRAPLYSELDLYAQAKPDVIANENDRKAQAVLRAIENGCDVIVDKPLAITMAEQEQLEGALAEHPDRKLLMLLTLRGTALWSGIRAVVRSGKIGRPAFCHVRMAVRLKRAQRPPWFLDARRSGGLFMDLLIHGIDQVEWVTGARIVAMTAAMGNFGDSGDASPRDHASVFCELDNGGSAIVEGQRMLPDTKGSDYRMLVVGTKGYADLSMVDQRLTVTSPAGADQAVTSLPEARLVVDDWLRGGSVVEQAASLRANRLSLLATISSMEHRRIVCDKPR